MTWTDSPPAVEGWYWYRSAADRRPWMVWVSFLSNHTGPRVWLGSEVEPLDQWTRDAGRPQWAGPIPEPTEAAVHG